MSEILTRSPLTQAEAIHQMKINAQDDLTFLKITESYIIHVQTKMTLSGQPRDPNNERKLAETKFQIFSKLELIAFLDDLAKQIERTL